MPASGYEKLLRALRLRAAALRLGASTPAKTAISPEALGRLNSIVNTGSPEALDTMIRDLGLDKSAVARKAASRFFHWLTSYYHFGYDSIGDALHEWLTLEGADKLGEGGWHHYLRLAGCVLISPELRRGVQVKGRDGTVQWTLNVPASDDWLEFLEEGMYQLAVAKNRDRKE